MIVYDFKYDTLKYLKIWYGIELFVVESSLGNVWNDW